MPVHPRIAVSRLRALLRQFPSVSILGARQIGKSTLARSALPGWEFLDLENPADLRLLERDPMFVLSRHRKLVLDEAQRYPPIFPALRSFLDAHPDRKVVLLGSASPGLIRGVSESLAGRTALLELGGLSLLEHPMEGLWIQGAYPRVHWGRPRPRPAEWYPAYLRACLERDIPQLGFRISAQRLRALITMVAHMQGAIGHLSELSASLGINYHSVAAILDIFEGIYLIRRLQPYFANIGKRLVKSPKIYLRDNGVLHSLLEVPFSRSALLKHPKAGASFETFCLEQILLHASLVDPSARGWYFRTHKGVEVDLILEVRGGRVPIEIKLGTSPPDTRGLETCMSDLGLRKSYVVNLTAQPKEIRPGIWMCGLEDLLRRLRLIPVGARGAE